MLPPPELDPESVRRLADEILADPRYDVGEEPLLDRILGWFGDQIGKVLGSLVGSDAGGVIAWMFVLAAVGLVVFLIVRYGRGGRPLAVPERGAQTMIELTRTPEAWRAEAEALEARGDWHGGLRCRHRALVGDLVLRGVIPDQAGRTAGEYVTDVAEAQPDHGPAMAAATELFEAAWYGGAATGPAEAARFEELAGRVLGSRVPA